MSRIDAPLFCGLLDAVLPRGGVVVAFSQVYVDESGTHAGSPVMTVAGYLFRSVQAHRFAKSWSKHLARMKLEYAHMADCTCGSGPYAHLDENERIESERLLIEHIKRRTVFGFGVSLDPKRYAEVVAGDPRAPSAYSFCLYGALVIVRRWIEKTAYSGRIHYFFEAGHQHQQEANRYMAQLSESPEALQNYAYSGHTFVDKREAVPLQAADMLAWQYQHYLRRKMEGHDKPRGDFLALLRTQDKCIDYVEENLEEFRRVYLGESLKDAQSPTV